MPMQFWKGNKLVDEFSAEPAEVAKQFVAWRREQPSWYRQGMLLERQLRDWLTREDGFNASWIDEGPEGFGAIFDAAYDAIFGTSRVS